MGERFIDADRPRATLFVEKAEQLLKASRGLVFLQEEFKIWQQKHGHCFEKMVEDATPGEELANHAKTLVEAMAVANRDIQSAIDQACIIVGKVHVHELVVPF